MMIRKYIGAVILWAVLFIPGRAGAQRFFDKIVDTTSPSFTLSRPYYITEWKTSIPNSVKIIRQLDERTAVILLNDQQDEQTLKGICRIAAANDAWKYSPFAEKIIEEKN